MKKAAFRRVMSVMLALLLVVAALPLTANNADAASFSGCLSQHNSKWGDRMFSVDTISASGGGILALVNAVGYVTGKQMDVITTALWANSVGGYNASNTYGVNQEILYPQVEAKYGRTYGFTVDCGSYGSGYWEGVYSYRLKEHLKNGGSVIGAVPNHFIAIVGYNEATNQFRIFDSSPSVERGTDRNNGDVWVSQNELATDKLYLNWFCLVSAVEEAPDKPVITDVRFSDASAEGYTISCKVTDPAGIKRVAFPTWTVYDGQDDLADDFMNTQQGTKDGDIYTFRVDAADHNDETGDYITHIYAENRNGDVTVYGTDLINVRDDDQKPQISDVLYSDFSINGYTVSCRVTDDWGVSSVAFPTWTLLNDQDDLAPDFLVSQVGEQNGDRYSFRVDISDHNNELGYYVTHIYATDCSGNQTSLALEPFILDNDYEHPIVNSMSITNVSKQGYTVTCSVEDDWCLRMVSFSTWTEANGKDDLTVKIITADLSQVRNNEFSIFVPTSDHNSENGAYITQISAEDSAGHITSIQMRPVYIGVTIQNQLKLRAYSSYELYEGTLNNIAPGTTVDTVLSNFTNSIAEVVDMNGMPMSRSSIVGTGCKVQVHSGSNLYDSVEIVVLGDVDGNGIVDATDFIRIKSAFLEIFPLTNIQNKGADVNRSEFVDATDFLRIKSHFLEEFDLYR